MFKLGSLFYEFKADQRSLDTSLSTAERSAQAAAKRMSVPVAVRADTRHYHAAVKDLGKSAAVNYFLDRQGTRGERVKRAVGGAAEGYVVGKGAERLAGPAAAGYGAFGVAKGLIDSGASKIANLAVKPTVDLPGLAGSAQAAKRVLMAPFKAGSFVVKLGVKIAWEAAQVMLFKKIKEWTGASTVKIIASYAAFKVGLEVGKRLLHNFASTAKGLALVPIRVPLAALRAGLRSAVSAVKGAAKQMGGALSTAFSAAGNAAGSVGPVGLLAGLVGIPAAIGGAVWAASNLEETTSKVGFAFHDAAKIIFDDADNIARKLGVPKREFLEAAASIGMIAKASGQGEYAAARMGSQFAKLAADASSFYNISLEEALEKIRAGLVGEAEPLRELGILLSADAVDAQAAAMGFRKVNGEFTEGEKVQARAALITRGFADAQGDLARTSGSLANLVRQLWGRLENLAATLGQYLLPAAKEVASTLAGMGVDLENKVSGASTTFAAWGESLRQAATWIAAVYHDGKELGSLAGDTFKGLGSYLADSFKAAFANATNFAVYFADVLGQSIEKAVTNGLHKGLDIKLPAWAKAIPGVGPAASLAAAMRPGPYQERPAPVVPEVVSPSWTGPDVGGRLKAVGDREQARRKAAADREAAADAGFNDFKAEFDQAGREMERKREEERRRAEVRARAGRSLAQGQRIAAVPMRDRMRADKERRLRQTAVERSARAAAAARVRTSRLPRGRRPRPAGATTDAALKALGVLGGLGGLGGGAGVGNAAVAAAAAAAAKAPKPKEEESATYGFAEFARKLQAQQFENDKVKENTEAVRDGTAATRENTQAMRDQKPAGTYS